ncbi:hypothetical protein M9H77_14277 [Catharanthus roseus]|uniref:Uncharacterized protein n=1 Tax=Catharanthus roseus TaxID=4058 RepID=A0ACC0BMQ9_CATRO|nr:hypothetical protein M9H77_14277 [Catharanthus roseus]
MAVNEGTILESQAIEKLIATIDRAENRTQPWYDIYKNLECRSCQETKAIPRYLLNLNVIQGKESAKVILFEDVASIVIGCSGIDVNKSKYFQTMVNLNLKECKSLIKLNKKIEVQNGRLQVVVEAIEYVNDKLTTKLQETSIKERKLKCLPTKAKEEMKDKGGILVEVKKEKKKTKIKRKRESISNKINDIKGSNEQVCVI